jgi:hypothetical protein
MESVRAKAIAQPDESLTSVQREDFIRRRDAALKAEGFTVTFSGGVRISFKPMSIHETGSIADVLPSGRSPLYLDVGDTLSVSFEPRDSTGWDYREKREIDNSQFIDLRKGQKYEFSGWFNSCVIDMKKINLRVFAHPSLLSRLLLAVGWYDASED